MRLDALKHLGRAALALVESDRLVVFGSASLLAVHPELGLEVGGPLEQTMDADLIPFPFDEEIGRLLQESLGEGETFHQRFGYHADIIRPVVTEQFPQGWEGRLVPLDEVDRVFCLEPHDMAVAKGIAGREKDLALLAYLFRIGFLDPELVKERLRSVKLRESMIVKSHRALDEAVRRSVCV